MKIRIIYFSEWKPKLECKSMKRILEKILKIKMVWKAQQVTTNYKCCTSVSEKKKKKKGNSKHNKNIFIDVENASKSLLLLKWRKIISWEERVKKKLCSVKIKISTVIFLLIPPFSTKFTSNCSIWLSIYIYIVVQILQNGTTLRAMSWN